VANLAYLLFNIGTFLSALYLMRHYLVVVKWRRLLLAYFLVSIPFILWDVWAASGGHWGFNPDFTLGIYWFGLAFEEVLFFFTVPLVCLVIFLAVDKHVSGGVHSSQGLVAAFGFIGLLLATIWPELGYTRTVGIVLLVSSLILLAEKKLIVRKSFWQFQLILFGLFILANSVLTALPIVTYGEASMIGFRVATIPIEDFAYNFALINSFLAVYTWRKN
jgi:lycopene cyclase domain-containing protein